MPLPAPGSMQSRHRATPSAFRYLRSTSARRTLKIQTAATIKHKLLSLSAGDTAKWSPPRDPRLRDQLLGRASGKAARAEPLDFHPRLTDASTARTPRHVVKL